MTNAVEMRWLRILMEYQYGIQSLGMLYMNKYLHTKIFYAHASLDAKYRHPIFLYDSSGICIIGISVIPAPR